MLEEDARDAAIIAAFLLLSRLCHLLQFGRLLVLQAVEIFLEARTWVVRSMLSDITYQSFPGGTIKSDVMRL